MLTSRLVLSAVLLNAFSFVPAVSAADKLYLKNGDVFTGHIEAYSAESIKIKTAYGVFDIPLEFVEGAFSAGQDANDMLQQLLTVKQESIAAVQAVTQDTVGQKSEIAHTAEPTPERFWGAELSGNVNLGMSLKTGNSEKNGINLDSTVNLELLENQFSFGLEYNREEDDGDVSVDNRSFYGTHDYFFTDQWFVGSKAKFEQDDIDRLDLRSTLSSGLGYQPYKADDITLKFVFGPGYLYEEFEDGNDESALTANWAMGYKQKFYDDLFRLFHDHSLNAPNDDLDAYLFQSKSGIRVPLKQGIVASGQVDFDWDNDPAENTTEDDTTYSLKLGYEWP